MDIVNSLGNTLNRTTAGFVASAAAADPSSSSEAGGSKGPIKTASDVSGAILDIFKCSLLEVESYIATYDAKLKLEEEYVKGLKVMNEKSRDSLIKLDGRIASCMYIEPGGARLPKARQAWKCIRDDHLKEQDARLYYMETLRQGVIAPLVAYRDAQERIRKRVKEDLKISIGRYDEMRNIIVPRARKQYEKKCEESEQVRLQQQAVEEQRNLLTSTHVNMAREPSSQSSTKDVASPVLSSEAEDDDVKHHNFSSIDAALPRRSLSFRRNRNSTPSPAGISPKLPADAPLAYSPNVNEKKGGHFLDALRKKDNWDAARKEAPKKLNALLSRMREGGGNEKGSDGTTLSTSPHSDTSAGGTGGGLGVALSGGTGSVKSSHTIALKNVKTKREAEEADQAYRKAIFDLETLRLRREKTVSAAIASVVEARKELYLVCQAVWLQAETNNRTLANSLLETSGQVIQVIQSSLDSLDNELKRVGSRVPSLADLEEERICYVNYYFGECKDLIFGVSLVDYAFNRAQRDAPWLGPTKVEAPLIIRKCIAFIEERITTQGIYRISAKHTAIQNLAHAVERDEERFQFDPSQDEPAAVAGVLKLYLRQLPEAVMPIPWEERVRYTHERNEQIQSGFAALKSRIRRLPAINQATLKLLIEHLAKVASYSEQNKMNVANLSIVFGPLLLSQADHETTSIAAAMEEDRVTEDLIMYCNDIFDLSHAGAPLLPPVNATTKGDADLNTSKGVEQADSTAVPLTSNSNIPIVIPSGSLQRSNAVTKATLAGEVGPPPRLVTTQMNSSDLKAPLEMPGEWDHASLNESQAVIAENSSTSVEAPTVPMYTDSLDEPIKTL